MRKLFIRLAFCLALMGSAAQVRAQGIPVYDNLNFTENLISAINSVKAVLNQITLIRQNITKIQLQVRALRRLEAPNWRNLGQYLSIIEGVMARGEALTAIAVNMDEVFRTRFPGFGLPEDALLPDHVKARVMGGLESARSAVHAARAHYAQLRAAQIEMDRIKRSVGLISGHQEALESIVMTSAYAAEETMLLRHAILSSQMMQAITLASEYDTRARQIVLGERMAAGIAPLAGSRCSAGYSIRAIIRPGSGYAGCPALPPAEPLPLYPEYAQYGSMDVGPYAEPDWGQWGVVPYPADEVEYDFGFEPPEEHPPGGGGDGDEPPDEKA